MQCRCSELTQCRRDQGKLGNAQNKLARLSIINETVQYQSDRITGHVGVAFESKGESDIAAKIYAEKNVFDSKCTSITTKIQNMRSELGLKIQYMEREDEQFHIEEARRKREEEQRKAWEAAQKKKNGTQGE